MGKAFDVGVVPFNSNGWGPPKTAAAGGSSNLPLNACWYWYWYWIYSFPAFAEDDASFRLVDGKPPPRPKFGPKWRFQQQHQLPQRRDEEVEARKREPEKERARRLLLEQLCGRVTSPKTQNFPNFISISQLQRERSFL
ncbi:hypothetical protein LR48_Vigan879s000600 [Vigna angularis]|uniref:Uncharacterized protein n=1 Tax=Phaseolus angularis TaxID=3914 RepID=A0A0L9TI53_PHAAN|nr:hypothetical protein LR48_Vigan879s000600 [Vigna angularis]